MPGGRPRKSTEGVDEKTLKARTKATDYAEMKRLELDALKLEIIDCRDDLERMRRQQKEIKKDLKMYDEKETKKLKYSENIDNLLADYKKKNPNPTKVKKGATERVAKLLAEKTNQPITSFSSRKPKPAMSVMADTKAPMVETKTPKYKKGNKIPMN
jgi:hypothetical protein